MIKTINLVILSLWTTEPSERSSAGRRVLSDPRVPLAGGCNYQRNAYFQWSAYQR